MFTTMRVAAILVCLPHASTWHTTADLAIRDFAIDYVRYHGPRSSCNVLDVGGLVVNGGARSIFEAQRCKFVCMDIRNDSSVDVVSPPGKPFPFADRAFDLVVSTSAFEHDPAFWMTIREMARVTALHGFVYVNAPSANSYHGYPGDNWRFYRDAPAALAYWTGQPLFDATGTAVAHPLRVVRQHFERESPMLDNVMVWQRVKEPATWFALGPLRDDPLGNKHTHFDPNQKLNDGAWSKVATSKNGSLTRAAEQRRHHQAIVNAAKQAKRDAARRKLECALPIQRRAVDVYCAPTPLEFVGARLGCQEKGLCRLTGRPIHGGLILGLVLCLSCTTLTRVASRARKLQDALSVLSDAIHAAVIANLATWRAVASLLRAALW